MNCIKERVADSAEKNGGFLTWILRGKTGYKFQLESWWLQPEQCLVLIWQGHSWPSGKQLDLPTTWRSGNPQQRIILTQRSILPWPRKQEPRVILQCLVSLQALPAVLGLDPGVLEEQWNHPGGTIIIPPRDTFRP